MKILGIETSCDDTSCAVLDGREVLSNVTASQDAVHAPFGGVVPELAARRHLETIDSVLHRALETAGLAMSEIDAIAVTRGPGLVGSLLVGVSAARGLALRTGLPLFGVHHLEGHALSPLMHEEIAFPFLSMVVSGGHSSLYLVRDIGNYEEVASTRDDSAGEAFDKGAKMLGLGFPGGREIDQRAKEGDRAAIRFPRASLKTGLYDFSFSGVKTSLRQYLLDGGKAELPDVCASFQEAIVDMLLAPTLKAARDLGASTIVVSGGVSANSRLRIAMTEAGNAAGFDVAFPRFAYCTDNAAMIGYAGRARLLRGERHDLSLNAAATLPIGVDA
jgi:N6-L-threonylcarbamoyladenine synthase